MTDATRSGSRAYTAMEAEKVVAYLLANPGRHGVEGLTATLGVDGRTIRQIISDADGVNFIALVSNDGIGICRFQDEVESGTNRLLSQVEQMQCRIQRRRSFNEGADLPRLQGLLW